MEAHALTARILIVDGAPSTAQEQLVAHRGMRLGEVYRAALESQWDPELGELEYFILAAGEGEFLPQGCCVV